MTLPRMPRSLTLSVPKSAAAVIARGKCTTGHSAGRYNSQKRPQAAVRVVARNTHGDRRHCQTPQTRASPIKRARRSSRQTPRSGRLPSGDRSGMTGEQQGQPIAVLRSCGSGSEATERRARPNAAMRQGVPRDVTRRFRAGRPWLQQERVNRHFLRGRSRTI